MNAESDEVGDHYWFPRESGDGAIDVDEGRRRVRYKYNKLRYMGMSKWYIYLEVRVAMSQYKSELSQRTAAYTTECCAMLRTSKQSCVD
jgi:hypothetical protein